VVQMMHDNTVPGLTESGRAPEGRKAEAYRICFRRVAATCPRAPFKPASAEGIPSGLPFQVAPAAQISSRS